MQDVTEYVITLGDEIIPPYHGLPIYKFHTSQQKPLWIRKGLHIPVRSNVSGLKSIKRICTIKPNQDIDACVKNTFGNKAFVQSSVLASGATCLSERIYESTGFTVKSRIVCIKRQHGGGTCVDLSNCTYIGEVVTALKGIQCITTTTCCQMMNYWIM